MSSKKHQYFTVLIITSLVIAVSSMIHISIRGTGEESVRFLIQWTAKLSTFSFCIAFVASSLHYFVQCEMTRSLIQYRPHIGLTFGTFHTFHLFFLIWLQNEIHPVFTLAKTSSLIGGGLAYVLMYLMMLTTFPFFKTRLNFTHWIILHLVGAYWVWLIFFRSYFKQVANQDRGYFLLTLLVIVLLFRIARMIAINRKRLSQKVSDSQKA
jgi:hypothetical protein